MTPPIPLEVDAPRRAARSSTNGTRRAMQTLRVPPHDLDAEEAAIGACLLRGSSAAEVLDHVGIEDFYSDKHRMIAAAIRDLVDEGIAVDIRSVADRLRERGKLEDVGGAVYLSAIMTSTPTAAQGSYYAGIVAKHGTRRFLEDAILEAHEAIATGDIDPVIERLAGHLDITRRMASTHRPATSWSGSPLTDAVDASKASPEPTLLHRSDGASLLYPGKLHDVHGEPEAGKGWLGCLAIAEALNAHGTAVYLDFEDAPETLDLRLEQLGCDEQVRSRVIYVRPDEPLGPHTRCDLDALVDATPALVVIDGVTEAMTLQSLDGQRQNQDVAAWQAMLPRRFARAGAAVLVLDHVVKDKQARGRYATGGAHKLAGVDVSFELVSVKPFTIGRGGRSALRIHKDRHGRLRPLAEGNRIAELVMSDAGTLSLHVPSTEDRDRDGNHAPRLTGYMERISKTLEGSAFALSEARIVKATGGKATHVRAALASLVAEGFVEATEQSGRGGTHAVHMSRRPFREDHDDD